MDPNNNLFSASLEAINTSKRVDKFQRFFTAFQRECEVTLNNAQEWIKAELPLVANYIEIAPLKEELKSNKTSVRRKHLLSALIFEQAARDAVRNHQAATAGLMAIHMLNHVWQAKLEMNAVQVPSKQAPQAAMTAQTKLPNKTKAEQDHDLKREQILTSLIKKGEQKIRDSQIQKQNSTSIKASPAQQPAPKKKNVFTKSQKDLWTEAAEKEKLNRQKAQGSKNSTNKKKKRKANGMLSKVRTKFPLKRKSKSSDDDPSQTGLHHDESAIKKKPSDSLLDDPNRSAIMVGSGLFKDIDDSLIQERPKIPDDPNASGITIRKVMKKPSQDANPNDSVIQSRPGFSSNPNESGITVRKMLKKREQATHEPGSNTIIMKLASSAGSKSNGAKLSIPEQCQQAVNRFYQQFPGYDIVAIRHLAAEKVGVSPQYIENLNILPESS